MRISDWSSDVCSSDLPRGIALSEDNSLLYICVGDDDHIEVLDTETLEVVDTLPSGPDPELLVISPDGTRLYVANEDDNMVTVVDLNSGEDIAQIPVGGEPEGLGFSPAGKPTANTNKTPNQSRTNPTET